MKLKIFTKVCFCGVFLFTLVCANQTPFISMNGDCRYPAVVADGDTLYMVWLLVVGGNAGIYFRRSIDAGKVWSTDQRISNEGSSAYPPAIAVHKGVVHAAWIDYGETMNGELYYNRSVDGGKNWEHNKILMDEANNARFPQLLCKGDHVYMIWQDVENKTFFKASHDEGETWIETTLLAKLGKHSCYCYPPAICVNNDDVSVVWTDVREKGVRLSVKGIPLHKLRNSDKDVISTVIRRKSGDGGVTWSNEQVLVRAKVSRETKGEIDNPALLTDGSQSYMFWLDKRNHKLGEIFFAGMDFRKERFPISGSNLFPPEKRSPKRPSVVFDAQKRFHLTWASFLMGTSIVNYCQSDPDGNVLVNQTQLTSDSSRIHNPVIAAASSGVLNIFWFDETKEEWSRIFMKTSRDNGLTWEEWGSPEENL
jgi:hypothetical protein